MSCRIKRMQGVIKSATTGSTSELLRCRGIAHRARPGPPGPPLKPRLEICTERLDPSPSRLRLIVVYAEQPPAASSINAADACSAGPSGVGLGRRAGTVASARTELGRPEERHAERACAADASTLVCVIPFIKRAERGRHTPHNYESTPVDPLRHVGIVSSTEAHS